ncbi:MAG: ATP-binding protein [Roseateles sp.]|uniref:sensor histidine kinase n=1 Tax=Roseateles sp. TaxID=1971397 RepID=UPI0039E93119
MSALPRVRRPLRLRTQLLAVLALALVLADALVLALWWHAHGGVHPVAREQVQDRLLAVYRLAEIARPERIGVLLGAAQSPEAVFQVAAAPGVDAGPMTTDERAFAAGLHTRVGAAPAVRVRLGPLDDPLPGRRAGLPAWWPGQPAFGLRVALALPDGRWLNARLGPMAQPGDTRLIAASLLISALLAGGLVALALARLLRPWRRLADTMQRFGRGERPAPLPLHGPRELRELSASFNELQARLGRYVDERTRLLAAISHDLRAPLTALRLRVSLVDDPGPRAAMLRSLAELQELVDETLRFARDEHQADASEDLDLAALCAGLVDARRGTGQPLELAAPPGPLPWRGRPLALRRAIGNLLDNALRHGRRVRLVLHPPGAGGVRIDVDDDGPGIPPERLARVFEPYVRGDDGVADSFGLGLAIALSCVQLHGGTLSLSNRAEGGLRARIALPA